MLKVNSIKKIMYAADAFGSNPDVLPRQIQNIRERLNSGVDSNGEAFAPYMTERKTNHDRPLELASRLFDGVHYSSENTLENTLVKATISGEAAKIAGYQNVKRKFMPFSEKDRDDVRKQVFESLRKAMSQWH